MFLQQGLKLEPGTLVGARLPVGPNTLMGPRTPVGPGTLEGPMTLVGLRTLVGPTMCLIGSDWVYVFLLYMFPIYLFFSSDIKSS